MAAMEDELVYCTLAHNYYFRDNKLILIKLRALNFPRREIVARARAGT